VLGVDWWAIGGLVGFVGWFLVFMAWSSWMDSREARRNHQVSLELQRRQLAVLEREMTEADCKEVWAELERQKEEGLIAHWGDKLS
jgi:hypothetical protein